MLLLRFTSSAMSFGLKKNYIPTYWECKVSTEFAKLNIGVAFGILFRSISYSGVSPKEMTTYNTNSSDSVDN